MIKVNTFFACILYMSDNNTVYRILKRHPTNSMLDTLLCLYCNVTCMRSNFSAHKKSPRHIKNSPAPLDWQKTKENEKQINYKNKYVRFAPKEEIKVESPIESPESSESEEPTEVTLDDCSSQTVSVMKIKKQHFIAKQIKYLSPEEKSDYEIISKLLTDQTIPIDEFKAMYNRLMKIKM